MSIVLLRQKLQSKTSLVRAPCTLLAFYFSFNCSLVLSQYCFLLFYYEILQANIGQAEKKTVISNLSAIAVRERFSWNTLYIADISLSIAVLFPRNVVSCYFNIKSYKPTLRQARKNTTVPSDYTGLVSNLFVIPRKRRWTKTSIQHPTIKLIYQVRSFQNGESF